MCDETKFHPFHQTFFNFLLFLLEIAGAENMVQAVKNNSFTTSNVQSNNMNSIDAFVICGFALFVVVISYFYTRSNKLVNYELIEEGLREDI